MFDDGPLLLHLIGFLPVGAALLATARLVFGRRASHGDDSMRRGMAIAGWALIHLGVLGLLSLPGGGALTLWLVYLVIVVMAVHRHRQNERRSLVAMLAVCSARGIPLEQAARAFAAERDDDAGLRAARLAEALERGAPLPDALRFARSRLPLDAHLAAGVGWRVGALGAALGTAVDFREEFDLHLRAGIEKFIYLCWVAAVGVMLATFIMIKIVPVYSAMFMEFDLELPGFTIALIDVSAAFINTWFLYAPLVYSIVALALLTPFYYVGWLTWEPPLVRRLWRGVHTAWILQSLAVVVRRGRPIAEGLQLLAASYPRDYVAARLYSAFAAVENGEDWRRALQTQGLIRPTDAAVLLSGERAGNLAWTLEELAEGRLRRMSYRLRAAVSVLFPCIVLIVAAPVFFFAVGLFLPLIQLIRGLAPETAACIFVFS
ncbi:MAG: type II secretion system F family protein [Planctomycetes bacterium]|nr:type II secretion system F family protein [Planctomycetota bacterium]